MKSISKLLISLFLFLPYFSLATETYRWVDSTGQIHFSDREPVSENSTFFNATKIKTLKFAAVQNTRPKQKKGKKPRPRVISNCKKLKQQIQKLENALTVRQTAQDFDKKNKQLVSLRWQKVKSC